MCLSNQHGGRLPQLEKASSLGMTDPTAHIITIADSFLLRYRLELPFYETYSSFNVIYSHGLLFHWTGSRPAA